MAENRGEIPADSTENLLCLNAKRNSNKFSMIELKISGSTVEDFEIEKKKREKQEMSSQPEDESPLVTTAAAKMTTTATTASGLQKRNVPSSSSSSVANKV